MLQRLLIDWFDLLDSGRRRTDQDIDYIQVNRAGCEITVCHWKLQGRAVKLWQTMRRSQDIDYM